MIPATVAGLPAFKTGNHYYLPLAVAGTYASLEVALDTPKGATQPDEVNQIRHVFGRGGIGQFSFRLASHYSH